MSERQQIPGDMLQARFANSFRTGYNSEEIVIDFGQGYEGGGAVTFHTRIVTSPMYAKQMVELLMLTLEDFEAVYGTSRTTIAIPVGKSRREDG